MSEACYLHLVDTCDSCSLWIVMNIHARAVIHALTVDFKHSKLVGYQTQQTCRIKPTSMFSILCQGYK